MITIRPHVVRNSALNPRSRAPALERNALEAPASGAACSEAGACEFVFKLFDLEIGSFELRFEEFILLLESRKVVCCVLAPSSRRIQNREQSQAGKNVTHSLPSVNCVAERIALTGRRLTTFGLRTRIDRRSG